MKDLSLKIRINKPANEIFDFCLNPNNTPKWIDFIEKEKTNEWPPKLGTIYRNTTDGKKWNEYIITEFEKDRMFVMTLKNGHYHVRYTLTPIEDNLCELEYYEWVENGELEEPFERKHLEKLKEVIEKS